MTKLVSVCIITYNHGNYIEDALDSVLKQEGSFDLEIVIGEDCSNDDTRAVCERYAEAYPGRIKLLPSEKNLGVMPNILRTIKECSGSYVCLCEGDDYWINARKIDLQLKVFERFDETSLVFHNSKVVYEGLPKGKPSFFLEQETPSILKTEDIIQNFSIPTASMMFRRDLLKIPVWLEEIYNGDFALSLLLSLEGEVRKLEGTHSVYRKNFAGLSGTYPRFNVPIRIIELLTLFDYQSNYRFQQTIKAKKIELVKILKEIAFSSRSRRQKILDLNFLFKKLVRKGGKG
jgi:glycosyltransferase involved in cell wall biosynthesis